MLHTRRTLPPILDRITTDSRPLGAVPWPSVRWEFGLVLPLAVLLVFVTLMFAELRKDLLDISVTSTTSGDAIPGALVSVGSLQYKADSRGRVVVERPDSGTDISAHVDGFALVDMPMNEDADVHALQMQPSLVNGVLTDAENGQSVDGANVALLDDEEQKVAMTRSDAHGAFIFKNVPDKAMLRVEAEGFNSVDQPVGTNQQADVALTRSSAEGVVADETGMPIQGVVVHAGGDWTVTGHDGTFTLDNAEAGADVKITASGYRTLTLVNEPEQMASILMERHDIKGVYANWGLLTDPGGLDSLIEIANTTEVNAIVIDIKQDTVYYESQVSFYRNAGTVVPLYDVQEVLQKLQDNNIYAIARLVVFQDPLVAEAYPHLAVHDISGDLWRNDMGIAWVSAFHEELWDANIALAVEAIDLGFDEIQYDYVRFPTDGDLSTADFGRDYTAETREAAITEFMKRSYEAVHNAGGMLAADLFGYITIVDDEQYIGQRYSALEPYVDYVCMMIYPSHFSEGNIASASGHPNDYPYETIQESLERAELITPHATQKFRPWLQDFSYWNMRPYDAADVRAQIDAAQDFGANGWMLWGDPFDISVGALGPHKADE